MLTENEKNHRETNFRFYSGHRWENRDVLPQKLRQMLPLTRKNIHLAFFVAAVTARKKYTEHHCISTRGNTRALCPGDTRVHTVLSPPGMLPLFPQGMLFPPQEINVRVLVSNSIIISVR